MKKNPDKILGGHLLIKCLIKNGANMVFGVPGESFLAALDGMHQYSKQLEFVACRHEGGAAFMAEAAGKLTSKPGICFVTRGPGATNASIGVHTAFQDSTPMILFVGQVSRKVAEREAFQEIDYRRMFGQMAKWVAQIDCAERIPEYVNRAFQVATAGRQGPVVLALPEDMLMEEIDKISLKGYEQVFAAPAPEKIIEMVKLLSKAQTPLILAGGGGWDPTASEALEKFSERWGIPVACAYRSQDVFDNNHPNYVGEVGSTLSPQLRRRFMEADVIMAVGVRLGESTTRDYTIIKPPRPKQKLIHIHPGAEELGGVYQADVLIQSSLREFGRALAGLDKSNFSIDQRWSDGARADYLEHSKPSTQLVDGPNMGQIVQQLQKNLPNDTIYCSGAGNYSGWFIRFLKYRGLRYGGRTQLAPSSGAMGYGVPSAVAAKLLEPNRFVVSISGDGCFLMNSQEIATAVQYELPILFIVINNGLYGTIRMHQEIYFSGRNTGTEIKNPRFSVLAESYGLDGYVVTETEQFLPILKRALQKEKSSLIEIQINPNLINTNTTLSEIKKNKK